MGTKSCLRWLSALLLLGHSASAQSLASPFGTRGLEAWHLSDVLVEKSPPRRAELGWPLSRSGDPWVGALAAFLEEEPPPVTRETLDGSGGAVRYHGLPGGIVLGLDARAPDSLGGARIARDERGALGLRFGESGAGRFVSVPAFAPEKVRACARFVHSGLDGLVDLSGKVALAPAFAGTELGELLVRMDCLPHRLMPELRPWKTLIVDHDARVELVGSELVFAADLEVRGYDDLPGTGWATLSFVIAVPGADFIGPRAEPELGAELAPLAEIAGWLGFLRWLERADPPGFAGLCAD